MREAVRIDPVSYRLDLSALGQSVQPLRRDFDESKYRGRSGVAPDLLMWLGIAVASGVVGNIAYDALRSLIRLAFRSRYTPESEIVQWNQEERVLQTFTLSEHQVQGIVRRFKKYSEERLRLVRSSVGKIPPGRRKLDYAAPVIQPVTVIYLDAKGHPAKHPKKVREARRRPEKR